MNEQPFVLNGVGRVSYRAYPNTHIDVERLDKLIQSTELSGKVVASTAPGGVSLAATGQWFDGDLADKVIELAKSRASCLDLKELIRLEREIFLATQGQPVRQLEDSQLATMMERVKWLKILLGCH